MRPQYSQMFSGAAGLLLLLLLLAIPLKGESLLTRFTRSLKVLK